MNSSRINVSFVGQDEQDISEQVQLDDQLFDNLLSKTEQRLYFQSIDAPTKPLQ